MECPRCSYQTIVKANLIRHLQKKEECLPMYSFETREEIIKQLTAKPAKNTCQWCNKHFAQPSGLCKHRKICKKKPQPLPHVQQHVPKVQVYIQHDLVHQEYANHDGNQRSEMEGFVYCFANTGMPGIVKVGFSINVRKRMQNLGCGSTTPFYCCYVKRVANARQSEKELHTGLEKYRVPGKREFFQIDSSYVKMLMDKIEGDYYSIDNAIIKKTNQDDVSDDSSSSGLEESQQAIDKP
jgi:hypothetical protein